MSKLSKLLGKPQTFQIGEIELEIKPRTLGDIDLFMDMANEEKRSKAMSELIKRTLKDAQSDATDDEINNVAFQYFKELSEAILQVNGLSEKK